jgi:hypothetical protein
MNRYARLILNDFVEVYCREPKEYHAIKREQFISKSYDIWAINVILKELYDNQKENPIYIVENLRDRANVYCCMAKTDESKSIFVALYEMCNLVLDFLIKELEEE